MTKDFSCVAKKLALTGFKSWCLVWFKDETKILARNEKNSKVFSSGDFQPKRSWAGKMSRDLVHPLSKISKYKLCDDTLFYPGCCPDHDRISLASKNSNSFSPSSESILSRDENFDPIPGNVIDNTNNEQNFRQSESIFRDSKTKNIPQNLSWLVITWNSKLVLIEIHWGLPMNLSLVLSRLRLLQPPARAIKLLEKLTKAKQSAANEIRYL